MMLRRMFGHEREQVTEYCLKNKSHKLYISPDIMRKHEGDEKQRILMRNPMDNRLLGRPSKKWKIILQWILKKDCGL
jgi:hypothetical protein